MAGMCAALFAVLVTLGSPDAAVSVTETVAMQFTDFTEPGTITVRSFGFELYSRRVANPSILEIECAFWGMLPITFILVSAVIDWYFGRCINRPSAKPGSR
ncbi:hypothetical protein PX52LOC_01582 [Limnoglobus roseus]|uniref:Uncharacterized protein n=2 Tax=Limnoglobus roseus TaxID=2598579 RepID=A0A5C1A647_9BACT|nr:hypothetical protein PX52LOC_01582 [Limnoglobus roseus]